MVAFFCLLSSHISQAALIALVQRIQLTVATVICPQENPHAAAMAETDISTPTLADFEQAEHLLTAVDDFVCSPMIHSSHLSGPGAGGPPDRLYDYPEDLKDPHGSGGPGHGDSLMRAKIIPKGHWDLHREVLEHLYIHQDLQLRKVRIIMAQQYHFIATYVVCATLECMLILAGSRCTKNDSMAGV